MDKTHKLKKHRALFVRSVKVKTLSTTNVVLDSVGFIKQRNGGGILRLKLIGPVAELRALRMDVGARLKLSKGSMLEEREAA